MKENINIKALTILISKDCVLAAFYRKFISINNCSTTEGLNYIYNKFVKEDKFIAYEYNNILNNNF